jgi:hypothetical protein
MAFLIKNSNLASLSDQRDALHLRAALDKCIYTFGSMMDAAAVFLFPYAGRTVF